MRQSFEGYLQERFCEAHPEVLDDDVVDLFDAWLADLEVDELIGYAEAWHKGLEAMNGRVKAYEEGRHGAV